MSVDVTVAVDAALVDPTIARWRDEDLMRRMWRRDPTVWFDPPRPEIDNRLGWLDLPASSHELIPTIGRLASDAVDAGITDLVLCGMGGSSLAPEVFAATLPTADAAPTLTVVDTTHPDAIRAVTEATDPSTTWYLVSSKSGGTLETMSLFRHFWAVASAELDHAGPQFLAVTDPGSSLEDLGSERGFRAVVLADPEVGGRYSALSAFGLVPAGICGADLGALLAAGARGGTSCGPDVDLADNPGFLIGAALGGAARAGRPIAYFAASDPVVSLPMWVEQLIAESTGKEGTGIVPVDGGPVPDDHTSAVIVSAGADPRPDADITIRHDDPYDIAEAMMILEIATAVAGEVLGIHPFDQPDVQLAKTLAHRAMSGDLDAEAQEPLRVDDPALAARLRASAAEPHLYVSLQAYLPPTDRVDEVLEGARRTITDATGSFTTSGYGPRFLHSTGQLHKGGPPGGLFLQIVDAPQAVLAVPETDYSFGELVHAQAEGDRAALAERGRPVVAITLGDDRTGGLAALGSLLADTFGGA